MGKQKPNRKRLAVVLSVAFVLITLLTGILAILFGGLMDTVADKPSSSESESVSSEDGSEASVSVPEAEASEPEPESSEPEPEPEPEPVYFNVPDTLRAAVLTPGKDFLTGKDTARATVAAQLEKALQDAKTLTMNAIVIDTRVENGVLFDNSYLPSAGLEIDCVDYLVTKAREQGLYVYALYDVSCTTGPDGGYLKAASADGDRLDDLAAAVGEFVEKYRLDGVLLTGYQTDSGAGSYAQYLQTGGGMGYLNYQCQVPEAMLKTATGAIRKAAPGTQVGLLADAVWENASANAEGSDTKADYTALGSGNADTRAYVRDGLFDFVMVQNFGFTADAAAPFGTVAKWWADTVAGTDTRLYIMHAADKAATASAEQLTAQVIKLGELSGISGSAFAPLSGLVGNSGSSSTLIKYLNNEINEQWVLTQLAVTKPAQFTFTTQEQTVTFQGASDPQAEVTINGEGVPTNASGYFTIKEDLKAGLNTFALAHKGKTYTYNITREVQVIKEVSPTGSVSVDGGMEVTVSALAYEGAQISASIGGQKVELTVSETGNDEVDRNSGYLLYTGVFTAPSASATATKMGNITFTATANGETQTVQGAAVTVNKKAVMGDGAVVYVSADQAETFPINTLNDNSSSAYYPLPKGTMDKTYGDEIVYKNGKATKTYWKLESGVRVYSGDIKATNSAMPDQNEISAMSVKSAGAYTNVTLKTSQKVPYKVTCEGGKVTFQFEYTAKVPEEISFKENALFSDAAWSGSKLTLTLKKANGFLGYKAVYDGDSLLLRFNNSPGGLSGARVVVDPGHGGSDPGTLGFYPGKDEADINLAVAQKLVDELKSQGATVLLINPGTTVASRLAAARAFNPQALVSIHCNSSNTNSGAKGTEVYYFYPFQKALAANVSAEVSAALGTANRGAKSALFYMTREPQFASVLAELGFVSNEAEYTRLINSKYQTKLAGAIASGVEQFLASVGSGGDYSEDTSGDDAKEEESSSEDADREESSSKSSGSKGVKLDEKVLDLDKGDVVILKATSANDEKVTWKSDDKSVAVVTSGGKVVAKGNGTAYITASILDGSYSAECEVNVGGGEKGSLVTKLVIQEEDGKTALEVGKRMLLTVKASPSGADNTDVKWTTTDDDLIKLSDLSGESCKVEGLKNGTATVTAVARDKGKAKAHYEIKIGSGKSADNSSSAQTEPKEGVLVKSIEIDGPETLSHDGDRGIYTAIVTPKNAEDSGVRWEIIGGEEYVRLSNETDNSCKVEGLKKGVAKLEARGFGDNKKVFKVIKIIVR